MELTAQRSWDTLIRCGLTDLRTTQSVLKQVSAIQGREWAS